ncbi:hypothetical protein TNIN_445611 [Trichonephila inaurata madagascariensis]|uniref:Uncharacterized protein n=1 Tax=Trichonephila inaurata madagascariensis TaxID=2747483 RepID=A0A8X6WZ96_9ARAC|nr:hypothetical protein TNIN_445611 [Trichonephila inaurata madagascariensis]
MSPTLLHLAIGMSQVPSLVSICSGFIQCDLAFCHSKNQLKLPATRPRRSLVAAAAVPVVTNPAPLDAMPPPRHIRSCSVSGSSTLSR